MISRLSQCLQVTHACSIWTISAHYSFITPLQMPNGRQKGASWKYLEFKMIYFSRNSRWYIFPSKCVWKACFPILLTQGKIPAPGSIAHVIIIIKTEVFAFPSVIIFFRGCVPEMFVTSYSVTYCIYVPGKTGICFHYCCAVYDECK